MGHARYDFNEVVLKCEPHRTCCATPPSCHALAKAGALRGAVGHEEVRAAGEPDGGGDWEAQGAV